MTKLLAIEFLELMPKELIESKKRLNNSLNELLRGNEELLIDGEELSISEDQIYPFRPYSVSAYLDKDVLDLMLKTNGLSLYKLVSEENLPNIVKDLEKIIRCINTLVCYKFYNANDLLPDILPEQDDDIYKEAYETIKKVIPDHLDERGFITQLTLIRNTFKLAVSEFEKEDGLKNTRLSYYDISEIED